MTEQKIYQVGVKNSSDWEAVHELLSRDGTLDDNIPCRCVECVDIKEHSPTRSSYRMTEEEADQLKNDPRVAFVNIDYSYYPDEFKPPPREIQSTTPELIQRYSGTIKNYRRFSSAGTLSPSPDITDANRTGYQLLRCQQKLDPWVSGSFADSYVYNSNISQYGSGRHVDVIVADEGMWIGHPEFQNNSVLRADTNVVIENPQGYVGGNVLPGNGTCDVLDLVLDSPYYLDPEWFDADPANRLITRWDGTVVPVESVARTWWSNSSQRSAKFSDAGTVFISSNYTRFNTSGNNSSIPPNGEGQHGTPCGALTFGRSQGWAYNANKWTLDLYGSYGSGIEQGFDIQKIFHQLKPINPLFGTKNPTVSSNSWGYRSNKDPGGATRYYTHRSTSNVSYTSESGIPWLSHMGTQGDAGRWKSEMKPNSYTTALQELIESGVIFVAASGNSNQKQVESDHPDYNNYITATNGGTLEASNFFEFGIAVTGTTNRRGFPQQGGMYTENGKRIYPVINIGALDDNYRSSKEAKVGYSDRGNSIDVYAPADGTLAANSSYGTTWPRTDTYPLYRQSVGTAPVIATDTAFSGTSAACPVAAGFIATVLEWNRDWAWQDVKRWLKNLDVQNADNFYYGVESTTTTTSNWTDYQSLEGGDARVLYQGKIRARTLPGERTVSDGNLKISNGLGLRINKS